MTALDALTEFGLSARQAEIYVALRTHGSLTVTEIAKRTHIPRVSVYAELEEMHRRGIVSRLRKNRRQKYEAHPPSILLRILQRKADVLEAALPFLSGLSQANSEEFSAQLYEGHSQSLQAQRDFYQVLLTEKIKLVRSISHPELIKKFPRFVPLMIEQRRKMGIATQLLISESQRLRAPVVFSKGQEREMRYLPEKFPFNCTCTVGGRATLFIITQHREPVSLLVQSKSVSEMIAACFSFMWELARK